jgi:hypothetical protein
MIGHIRRGGRADRGIFLRPVWRRYAFEGNKTSIPNHVLKGDVAMADNVKALTKALAFMAESKVPVKQLKQSDLPSDVAAAIKTVTDDENVPVDDDSTSVDLYQISFAHAGISDVFIADYAGDDPDTFRIIVAVQDGVPIGISSDVAS